MNIDGTILIIFGYIILLSLLLALVLSLRNKARYVFVVIFFLVVIGGIGVSIYGFQLIGDDAYPVAIEHPDYESDDYELYLLIEEQIEVLNSYGALTGFEILFMGEKSMDRVETWYFAEEGVTVESINGSILTIIEDDTLDNLELNETLYYPEDYVFGINPGTALNMADLDGFIIVPLEDALLEEAQLYIGEDIILGFMDNQLFYVETVMVED